MYNITEIQVSLFSSFFDNEPLGRPLKEVVELATSENSKRQTEEIRRLRALANSHSTPIGEAMKAKKDAMKMKKTLSSFLTNVYCEHGKKRFNVKHFLPMIGFDVDHISEAEVIQLMEQLKADEHVIFAEPSCSRKGVHFVILTETDTWLNERWDGKDTKPYTFVWEQAKAYAEGTFNVEVDEACKNLEHIFAISYDELIHFNAEADPLPINTESYAERAVGPVIHQTNSTVPPGTYHVFLEDVISTVIEHVEKKGYTFTEGSRNNYVYHFAMYCNHYGVSQGEVEQFGETNFIQSDSEEKEMMNTIRSAYKNKAEHGIWYATSSCAKNAIVPTGTFAEKMGKIGVFEGLNQDVPSDILAQLAQLPRMTFTDKINREDWPTFCLPILDSQDDPVGRDKMILGSLNIISGVLPKSLYSIYDRRRIYPSLYTIIYGGFASKKGDLEACRKLLDPVKQQMRQQYEKEKAEYELALANWENAPKASRGKMPEEPTLRSPFIPANSSASAVYRALAANGGWGEIFDTEADTLTNMLSKKEYGDFSDLLRKAHHHEECSMARVGEHLFIEIAEPRLSVLLTCTDSQLNPLLAFDNFVNGLASRFLFYALLNDIVEFRNVFEGHDKPIEDTYIALGEQLFVLYQALLERTTHPIQFMLSKAQQAEFLQAFKKMLKDHYELFGDGIQGFIYRLALECYRITMVLTALRRLSKRLETGECLFDEDEQALCCDDRDFHIALTIIGCLVKHTVRVYEVFSKTQKNPFKETDKKNAEQVQKLYTTLPNGCEFTTAEAVEIAQRLQIPERTAKRYLSQMVKDYKVLDQLRQGVYQKKGKEVQS
ncbi:MAG: DUF3987 domain-containing protein [Parabacteroides sp.]